MTVTDALWDLSLPDWQERIRAGRSLIPDLPLFTEEADFAVAFFDRLRLPDVPGAPLLKDACGEWFRDIVRVIFGSRDPATSQRYIRYFFALVPKGSGKTTYSAALMVVALLMNQRPNAEFLFVAPVQATADKAFDQAAGMINLDSELSKRFRIRDHRKDIKDRINGSRLRVKTFALNILTGTILAGVLLDELHVLGRSMFTGKVLTQIRGGLEKTTEGFLLTITTQSDEVPQGAFRAELQSAREIRDGLKKGQTLPILYEFPPEIARDPFLWQDPANWWLVNPNLGKSIDLNSLTRVWDEEKSKGLDAVAVWASQHLNIEVGIGMRNDRWPGVEHWLKQARPDLTLASLMARSETIVVGIDGGGLDDLFGFAALGRCRKTGHWLLWSHAWCHEGVLDRRKSIAGRLREFAAAGELTIVDDSLTDLTDIVDHIETIKQADLLGAVWVDPYGLGEFVEALAKIDVTQENKLLYGSPQGIAMMNSVMTAERMLAKGLIEHSASGLMRWCAENIKIERTATAFRITKQNAGDAKIDPQMAFFNAVTGMLKAPEAEVGMDSYLESLVGALG